MGGAFTVSAPIYVAETSDPDIRGKLSAGFDMGIAGGILYRDFSIPHKYGIVHCVHASTPTQVLAK